MKTSIAILALTLGFSGHSICSVVEEVTPQRGGAVAAISWTDDAGRVRQLSQFAGYPLILLPIYSRCPGPCIYNVDQLKKALGDSSADPRQFRVLLFSFDSSDTPSSLARYRVREAIPLSWSVGTASQSSIDVLLQSMGFQYGKAGTEFMHPNLVLFVDSKLRISKWIYGTDYSARDVDRALRIAQGQADWIGRHSDVVYALLLFAASLLCVALCRQLVRGYEMRITRARFVTNKS